MTTRRERPRIAVAPAAAPMAIGVVAMLVGVALAGAGDCPPAGDRSPRTQR
jgi:hypothetical protein